MNLDTLKKSLRVPEEQFDAFLASHDLSWHQLARGEGPMPFEELQLALICSDVVLWCGAFLKEPDTGEPYRFFNYQLDSVRFWGHTLHKDGAEVGKTREIVALILWRAFTCEGKSSLISAPEQVHLDEIIEACVEQMNLLSPELGKSLKKHKKHPHHVFYFKNRYKVYFSPTGFEGTSLRGKHCDDMVMMDEAAKVKNADIWREFWRAGKPGCTFRLYSVPDGDRSTVFYRLSQLAQPYKNEKDLRLAG